MRLQNTEFSRLILACIETVLMHNLRLFCVNLQVIANWQLQQSQRRQSEVNKRKPKEMID